MKVKPEENHKVTGLRPAHPLDGDVCDVNKVAGPCPSVFDDAAGGGVGGRHEYKLTHQQALVIVGTQGCGKSTLAREIAEKHGSFIETDIFQLLTRKWLNDLLMTEPRTLIVDGFPKDEDTRVKLKAMMTNDNVMVERKHGPPKIVKTPNFIFCTGEWEPLETTERRFYAIRMGEPT